jgi:CheY-like chemotaxis protein
MAVIHGNEEEIWIVDDDCDDHDIIREIFKESKLSHPLVCFTNAEDMLERLNNVDTAPFMIISDINLPKVNGFAMREKMLQTPNNKFHGVPFLFWSSYASDAQIKKAFDLGAHGFFLKEHQFAQWKATLLQIINYWEKSKMPTKEDKYDPSIA